MKQENETTALPLYKRLDEERTQGEWMVVRYPDLETPYYIEVEGRIKEIIEFNQVLIDDKNIAPKEPQANAQYTALAVNNLSSLADTLQAIIDNSFDVSNSYVTVSKALIEQAKAALSAIS